MCVANCQKTIKERLSRRHFLQGMAAVAGLGLAGCTPTATPFPAGNNQQGNQTVSFNRVVDLTHTMGINFPTYFGEPQLEIEVLNSTEKDGFNIKRWLVVEHTGTHLDAPFHFGADQDTADEIPVEKLVVPLAVIDIRAKSAENPDAQVTPDDLKAWEEMYGPLPVGVCVAMNSGWGSKVGSDAFRNADDEGLMHFPGFHVEAAQFLMEERDVVGIAVDTLSLDYGLSPDFATHFNWLPSNRWGIENIANLDQLPAVGATIVVGGPKIEGATGGPSRVLALV